MRDIAQGDLILTWMFALIDPAGESSMGPRTWDRRLGAFTKGQ
jgi:hypothetical protein